MKKIILFISLFYCTIVFAQVSDMNNSMNTLFKLSNAKTRSISPENFTGEKGKGGMATLKEGNAAKAARELGQGWKVNPYVHIKPGETFTMAEIETSGIINHIWMTPTGNYRLLILRFYWDGETEPSVEVPVGDFFVSGWGWKNEPQISSLAICVNPSNGFNSYWQMPFHKKCKVTMENMSTKNAVLYYQITYSETEVPEDAAYFHAQFRRSNPLPDMTDHTIVDNIKGKGQYVGTYVARGANSPGWWGEGEVKFFIDGDGKFPTICGTGEEDYFCGSYGYEMRNTGEVGKSEYTKFTTPYAGFYYVQDKSLSYKQERLGEYRWHILDPIRFENDLRVTLQSLGWQSGGRYLHLKDDIASVAYWYQTEPHNPFPNLPSKKELIIINSKPIQHKGIGKKVKLISIPSSKYNPGVEALTDGLIGSEHNNDGQWMGFEGIDIEMVLDLGEKITVNKIKVNFLSDQNAWIFLPEKVEYLISENGKKFKSIATLQNEISQKNSPEIRTFLKEIDNIKVRYIKFNAKNIKNCPQWHKDNGGKAWLFVDEIIVE